MPYKNRDHARKKQKAYQKEEWKNNPEFRKKHSLRVRMWRKKNPEKIRLYQHNAYIKYRDNPDSMIKIKKQLRSRACNALKYQSTSRNKKISNLLGISTKGLRTYLENKFKKGMTWQNHGKYGWHMDHIIPLSKFDLIKKEEQQKAFHFTNLQPLWAKENLRKSDNII